MNIALIFPRTRYPSGQPPLGILSLAAYLRRESNAHVDIFDLTFRKKPFDYLRQSLSARRYEIVGLSVMTSMVRDAERASAIAHQTNPQALVMWGGPHATVLPADTLAVAGFPHAEQAKTAVPMPRSRKHGATTSRHQACSRAAILS